MFIQEYNQGKEPQQRPAKSQKEGMRLTADQKMAFEHLTSRKNIEWAQRDHPGHFITLTLDY